MVNLRNLDQFVRWYRANYDTIVFLREIGEDPLEAGIRIFEIQTNKAKVSHNKDMIKSQKPEFSPEPLNTIPEVNPATSKEPTPKGSGINIVDLVKEDIEARAVEGEKTYGERLKAFNGRSGLTDAYQEAVDLTVYLRQVLEERKKVVALAHQIKVDLRSELMPYFGEGSRGLAYLNKSIEALEEISIIIK